MLKKQLLEQIEQLQNSNEELEDSINRLDARLSDTNRINQKIGSDMAKERIRADDLQRQLDMATGYIERVVQQDKFREGQLKEGEWSAFRNPNTAG